MRAHWGQGAEFGEMQDILRGMMPALNRIFGRVWEEKDAYWVEAQVPGFSREQLSLQAHQQQLTLSTVAKKPAGEDSEAAPSGVDPWASRRASTAFKITWDIPLDVDVSKIEARLSEGLFKAKLPRRQDVSEVVDIVVK